MRRREALSLIITEIEVASDRWLKIVISSMRVSKAMLSLGKAETFK
jgi:hypothetical protein